MKSVHAHGKLCLALLTAVVLLFLFASPVLAYLYRATFTVAEGNGTDYTGLAVNRSADVDWMITNGFITSSTALDTRIETLGGVEQLHMMVDDRIMAFVPELDGNSQVNWYLTTGNTALPDFPVITGYGGYVTTADAAALEPGGSFNLTFNAWVDNATSNSDLAFPVVAGTNTSYQVAPATTHTVNLPDSFSAGDLLILLFRSHDGDAHVITAASGWTTLWLVTTALYGYYAAYKIATGAETSSINITTSVGASSAHEVYRITGYAGVPEIAYDGVGSNGVNPDPPALTPSWGAMLTLWIAGYMANDDATWTTSAVPASYANGLDNIAGAGALYVGIGTARRNLYAASENPGTFTVSQSVGYRSFTIGVKGTVPADYLVGKPSVLYVYPDAGELKVDALMNDGATIEQVIATDFTQGENLIYAWADGTNLGVSIGGVTKDTEALAGGTVYDSSGNWILDNMPYYDYYMHYVSGTLVAWYQPVALISGTTLPDREGAAQNGAITWGSNPAGVTVVLGSLTAPETTITVVDDDTIRPPVTPPVETTDWFLEPDIGVKLATHPFRPLVTLMSDTTTITEVQAWRFLGLVLVIAVTVMAAIGLRGHLLIAGLACGGAIAVLVQQTIWPGWTLVFIIPTIIAGIMAERTPSIG